MFSMPNDSQSLIKVYQEMQKVLEDFSKIDMRSASFDDIYQEDSEPEVNKNDPLSCLSITRNCGFFGRCGYHKVIAQDLAGFDSAIKDVENVILDFGDEKKYEKANHFVTKLIQRYSDSVVDSSIFDNALQAIEYKKNQLPALLETKLVLLKELFNQYLLLLFLSVSPGVPDSVAALSIEAIRRAWEQDKVKCQRPGKQETKDVSNVVEQKNTIVDLRDNAVSFLAELFVNAASKSTVADKKNANPPAPSLFFLASKQLALKLQEKHNLIGEQTTQNQGKKLVKTTTRSL